jgi:type II secretory pathway pseudopilin PulG
MRRSRVFDRAIKAFTLTELMLAICIMSVIGLAVATVASGLSNAYGMTDTLEDSIQSGRSAMMNMEAAIRKSKLVLARSASGIALWMGDANDDGKVNIDEIVLVQQVEADRSLETRQVVFPKTLPWDIVQAINEKKTISQLSTIGRVSNVLDSGAVSTMQVSRVLAGDVESFNVATDATPPWSTLVNLRLTTGSDGQRITLTNSTHLRADAVDSVVTYNGLPVLKLE